MNRINKATGVGVSARFALVFTLLAFGSYAANLPMAKQKVRLYEGWNLFHLSVAPTGTADQVFRDFPVTNGIAMYDAESFGRTRQFGEGLSAEGLRDSAMRMWYRDDPGASTFRGVMANAVYLCNVTSAYYETEIEGIPEAARLAWHATDASTVMNYIGPSLDPEAGEVKLADYFRNADIGLGKFYRVAGWGPGGVEYEYLPGDVKATDGEAFAIAAERGGTWSGPLYVSPRRGFSFDLSHDTDVFSVRNDTTVTQEVRITFSATSASGNRAFRFCDYAALSDENAAWTNLNDGTVIACALGPNETRKWNIAAEIPPLTDDAGGILTFRATGPSRMLTSIPVFAERPAGDREIWPHGLWVLNAVLGRTTWAESRGNLIHGMKAGGAMKVRLPIYVDALGNMTLLQRVDFYAPGTSSNDVMVAYSGAATPDLGSVFLRRISSTVLPLEDGEARQTDGGRFGDAAEFAFVVAAGSPLNPMHHHHHPNHDGLTSDFKAPLPSGDDFNAYNNKEKPELFSVSNTVRVVWSQGGAWNPEKSLTGTLSWTFSGLHQYGDLVAEGEFTMTRVMPGLVRLGEE